jgi:transposase
MGACFRRIAARRGLAQAITATASKLARIIYALLKHGTAYVAQGLAAYATASRERVVRQVKRQAAELGLVVVERDAGGQPS